MGSFISLGTALIRHPSLAVRLKPVAEMTHGASLFDFKSEINQPLIHRST
jgi:hypothetical protein